MKLFCLCWMLATTTARAADAPSLACETLFTVAAPGAAGLVRSLVIGRTPSGRTLIRSTRINDGFELDFRTGEVKDSPRHGLVEINAMLYTESESDHVARSLQRHARGLLAARGGEPIIELKDARGSVLAAIVILNDFSGRSSFQLSYARDKVRAPEMNAARPRPRGHWMSVEIQSIDEAARLLQKFITLNM